VAKLRDIQLGTSKLLPFAFDRRRADGETINVRVVLRVLSKREMDLARANAESTVKDLKVKEGRSFDELFEEAKIVEILAVACRDPDAPEQPWANPLELATSLSAGEITVLWEAYTKHQDECSPILGDVTEEQFEALVDMIAREGDTAPLLSFASPLRNACIVTMARAARDPVGWTESRRLPRPRPSPPARTRPTAPEVRRRRWPMMSASSVRTCIANQQVMIDDIASLKMRLTHRRGK
jgi:hypothetical protein